MKRTSWLLWGALALPVGCGSEPAPPPTDTERVVARIQGEWRISLTPTQRRQVRTMKFLLQVPPPSNDALAELKLTDDEASAAVVILNEIRYDPEGERTQQLRAAIAGLEAGELTIGPDRLEVRLGGVHKSGRYTAVTGTGDKAHLRLERDDGEEESVAVALTPEGELVFGEGVDAVTFVRR